MPALSRKGDTNAVGGKIINGASTVFANGQPVGLHVSQITPHQPYSRRGGREHQNARTTSASSTVFADGKPVLRVGSSTSCGHNISQGSPNVFVP